MFPEPRMLPLRTPCPCGWDVGRIENRGGQDCLYCDQCGKWQYNAPRTETGRAVRTMKTVHAGITASRQDRIFRRDEFRCIICGRGRADGLNLHIAHILSVEDGMKLAEQGWKITEYELNSDANLLTLCETCNAGQSGRSLEPWLYASLLWRQRHAT